MMTIIFAMFAVVGFSLFWLQPPARAASIVCMAGWLLLPVGNYPEGSVGGDFPYWITGAAVPSDMLITKMWVPPLVALAGALAADWKNLSGWRPGWIDVPVLLWCAWPLLCWPFWADAAPSPLISALYLAASWGAPWLLGRLYFSGKEGGSLIMMAMAASVIVLAPMALIEGIAGPEFYAWLYETHPFRTDGIARYIGFRPLALFENGNQYGIWIAMAALAAAWLWHAAPDKRMRKGRAALALAGIALTLASQSAGAIILLFFGVLMFAVAGRPLFKTLLPLALFVTLAGGAAYMSGAVPLRAIASQTAIGRMAVDAIRSTGRGSFTWRMARDQDALAIVSNHPLTGGGRWDWWRANGERPWGLAFQIFGQFGLLGLLLSFGAILFPALRTIVTYRRRQRSHEAIVALPLALIVLLTMIDGLLNSFLFYPAIIAAGAIAARGAGDERSSSSSVSRPVRASHRSG